MIPRLKSTRGYESNAYVAMATDTHIKQWTWLLDPSAALHPTLSLSHPHKSGRSPFAALSEPAELEREFIKISD